MTQFDPDKPEMPFLVSAAHIKDISQGTTHET